jgi:hypothetical protein
MPDGLPHLFPVHKSAQRSVGAGIPGAAIVAVLAERDVSLGWRKYSDRADAPQQYQRVVTFLQQQPR